MSRTEKKNRELQPFASVVYTDWANAYVKMTDFAFELEKELLDSREELYQLKAKLREAIQAAKIPPTEPEPNFEDRL